MDPVAVDGFRTPEEVTVSCCLGDLVWTGEQREIVKFL